jgi:hypothetical protein
MSKTLNKEFTLRSRYSMCAHQVLRKFDIFMACVKKIHVNNFFNTKFCLLTHDVKMFVFR